MGNEMIYKIEFDSRNELVMLFGDTKLGKWHKYFKKYVEQFREHVPNCIFKATVCEMRWPETHKGYVNAWMHPKQFMQEYPGDYSKLRFYEITDVAAKCNKIIFKEKFEVKE